jgi:hypothetical protein
MFSSVAAIKSPTFLTYDRPGIGMSYKKEIEEPLDVEQAKDLELDEMPKPTRKVSNPSVPVPDSAEPSTHDRIKGRRIIK